MAIGRRLIDLEGDHIILHEEEEHFDLLRRSLPIIRESLKGHRDMSRSIGCREAHLHLWLLLYELLRMPLNKAVVHLLLIVGHKNIREARRAIKAIIHPIIFAEKI